MYAEQRQETILRMLEEYKQVDVTSLSTLLDASEATVRRDLEKLERAGMLHRTHGGAIWAERGNPLLEATRRRSNPLDEERRSIGEAAARIIAEGEVVAISAGELGLALARSLDPELSCTIVTNDALIMSELLGRPQVNVIMIGGLARKTGNSVFTSGETTLRMLGEFHVSKAFLGVDGICLYGGLTTCDFEYALIWKKLMSIARDAVILATAEAFGKLEWVKLVPVTDAQCYVTSAQLEDSYKKFFFEHNIPIHLSFDL